MELHQTIRDLVVTHGDGILSEAAGFRGVLDDVLDEGAASTGDINLLVDAVRFDALSPLARMIDGGADPARAVEETGARLARDRGGDDVTSASWAVAVLGHAKGLVPEALITRYRSQRAPGSFTPPSPPSAAPLAGPGTSPIQPPTSTPGVSPLQPPTVSPVQGAYPPPPQSPPTGWPPVSPGPSTSPFGTPPPKKSHKGVLLGGLVALVLLVVGGIGAAIGLSGGGDDHPAKKKTGGQDLSATALDERYAGLAGSISKGTSACRAGTTDPGQSEVVTCTGAGGTLTLATYDSLGRFKSGRHQRFDAAPGSISHDAGQTAYYAFDPDEAEEKSKPAVVYWDSESGLQSATLTGAPGVPLATLTKAFEGTNPTASMPTGPVNPTFARFLDYFIDSSTCRQHPLFLEGASEEVTCSKTGDSSIGVVAVRFPKRAGASEQRAYFRQRFNSAIERGHGGHWQLPGDLDYVDPGAYYSYRNDTGTYLYWDWSESGCNCLALAVYRSSGAGSVAKLDAWWRKASTRKQY